MQVYNGTSMGTTASGQTYLRMVSNTACLNQPNTANLPSSAVSGPAVSGHYGAFETVGDLTTTFAGHNANAGTWTLYWFEDSVREAFRSSSNSLRSFSSSLTLLTHAVFVHTAGQSSNPLWGDLGLVMGFVEDMKRGRLSANLPTSNVQRP
jgi:hypothetical protein